MYNCAVASASADIHLGLALLDHEEAHAARAFLRHDVARLEAALPHAGRDLLQLAVVEAREQRHLLQHLHRGLAHAAIYTPLGGASIALFR